MSVMKPKLADVCRRPSALHSSLTDQVEWRSSFLRDPSEEGRKVTSQPRGEGKLTYLLWSSLVVSAHESSGCRREEEDDDDETEIDDDENESMCSLVPPDLRLGRRSSSLNCSSTNRSMIYYAE